MKKQNRASDVPVEWSAHEAVYKEHFSIKVNPFDQYRRFNGNGHILSVYQAILLDGIDRELRAYTACREWAHTLRRAYKYLNHFTPSMEDEGTNVQTLKLIKPLVLDEIERILIEGEVYEMLPKFKVAAEKINRKVDLILDGLRGYRPRPRFAIMSGDKGFIRLIRSHDITNHGELIGFEISDNVEYYPGHIIEDNFHAYGDISAVVMGLVEIEKNSGFDVDTDNYKLYCSDGTMYQIYWANVRQSIHFFKSNGGEFIVPLKKL